MKNTHFGASLKIWLLFIGLWSLSAIEKAAAQTQLYVDSSIVASGNGTSWATAYSRLTDALNYANSNTGKFVVNVAQGTYTPTSVSGAMATSKDSSFAIYRKGISILGGYPAGGGVRNSKQYVTRLSGNIGSASVNTDNVYHVLVVAINANTADSLFIDGVNIEGGYASDFGSAILGGVLFYQYLGGGIYINNNSGSTIGNVFLKDCLLQNNYASIDGGGMENFNCSLIMTGSSIFNNSSGSYGGGLNNEAGGSLILVNNVFSNNNSSGFGGALRVSGSSLNQVVNCTFTNNTSGTGAAIRVASLGTATVYVHNSVFRGNHSGTDYTSTNADVSNGSILFIDTSCLQSSQSCTGCLVANTDPQFVDINNPLGNDGFFGTADDGIMLTSASPCVNAGNNGIINFYGFTTDIAGATRIQATTVDLGAYERGPLASIVTNGSFGTTYLCSGTPSLVNSFNVSGSMLTQDITITPPAGFEVSLSTGSGFTSGVLTLAQTGGIVLTTTVYVRVSPSATGNVGGDIEVSSPGAISHFLNINGVIGVTGTNTTTASSCTGYTWSVNNQTYTQSGTYTVVNGCQTEILNLTIGAGGGTTTNITACESYLWSVDGQTYTSSGTYTASNGCNTSTLNLTINALPAVDAGTNTAVCAGQTVTLSGAGAISYSWNNSVSNGVAFAPASTATYTVTGTDGNGCVNTDHVTISVNALPNVNAGSNSAVCAGGSITLSGTGATSYSWNNSVTNGVSFTPVSTATYTVTGTDGNGCVNTDDITITVNALPNVGAGSDMTICGGSSVTLSGSGASSYSWSGGIANGVAFTPALTATYTVTGTDGNGCVNTDNVVVNVHNPVLNVSSPAVCKGDTIILTAPAGTGYLWKKNGVKVNNQTTNTLAVFALGAASYTITYTDPICGLKTPPAVATMVNALPTKPAITITASSSLCPGTTATLTAPAGNSSYQWMLNGSTVATTTVPAVNVTIGGNYTLAVTDANGCISQPSAAKTVTYKQSPAPTFSVMTSYSNGSKKLMASNHAQYQWNLNGSPISGATGRYLTITQSGNYSVTATGQSGCSGTSPVTAFTIVITGSKPSTDDLIGLDNNMDASAHITIAPNPSTGIFRIWSEEPVRALVRDLQGRVVADEANATAIDLTEKAAGIYIMQLLNSNGALIQTEKLNKQ